MTAPSGYARLFILSLVALFFFLCSTASCASVAEWRSRSIYQVLTDRFVSPSDDGTPPCAVVDGRYCGGTWQGIKSKLDYIQGMNFDAIWISPVVAQLPQMTGDGEAYTGYWAQDLYALNPQFGTANDLQDLIAEVHSRGMYLMLDIVVNHMGYAGPGWYVDYSVLNPFNDQSYFHDYCTITDPEDQANVETCWLGDTIVTLADLRTENENVQSMYGEWISGMVQNYSIDGLRIDTSINVEPSFFPGFVDTAGIFATGEVMMGDDTVACQWAESIGSILNYPIYYTLTRAFQSTEGSIDDLVETINSVKANCYDPTTLGSFSENHDVPRFANYTDDMALAKNIITYTMLADGIPIIYQGQEQHMNGDIDPYMNRAPLWQAGYDTTAPLYQHIATVNQFRQHVISAGNNYTTYMNEVIYQDMHSLGMRKGFNGSQVLTVLNNNGEDADYFVLEITGHEYEPGTQLTEIMTCTNATINETGYLNVEMFAGTPKVFYPAALLINSSICGTNEASEPFPSATTVTTAYSTTINGQPTVVSTVKVSPVPATTTTGGGSPAESTQSATHSPKALGAGDTMLPDMPMIISAAVAATMVSAGYLATAQMLDSPHA